MDTLNSQIILDDKLIHPETKAQNVIYGNTNAKAMMDSVLSSADLSSAVKTLLTCQNYTAILRTLRVNRETYFDECFNTWLNTNSPYILNGKLHLDGTQSINTDDQFSVNGTDFCVQIAFTPSSTSSTYQWPLNVYNNSSNHFFLRFTNSTWQFGAAVSSTSSQNLQYNFTSPTPTADTEYYFEADYDASTSTWYIFMDGTLVGSPVKAFGQSTATYRLGIGKSFVGNSNFFTGTISTFRFSNCIRHTTSHSDIYSYKLDDNTLSLLYFND